MEYMNGPAPGWEARADSFAPMAGTEMVLLLGGNVGDPARELDRAQVLIAERIGTVGARSRDHWTEPWGFAAPTLFLNRALLVRTGMDPRLAMEECLAIERAMGRERPGQGGPVSRNIDIDILAIGALIIDLPGLTVPHPRLHLRRFALAPLADVAPQWGHPILGRTALQLLNELPA